jgi:hypothetical protein
MITLTVGERRFGVTFRHITNLGRRRALPGDSPVKAITTCVMREAQVNKPEFVAIESAVCMEPDNFSRAIGRAIAFKRVLERNRPYLGDAGEVLAQRLEEDLSMPRNIRITKIGLSPEEKAECIASGESVRSARRARRVASAGQ